MHPTCEVKGLTFSLNGSQRLTSQHVYKGFATECYARYSMQAQNEQ